MRFLVGLEDKTILLFLEFRQSDPIANKLNFCVYSLNSRDLFLNLRRRVKMTKPLRFENKSLRLKYKCLICI